ncbi:MAG: hypothetical protein M3025_00775, partial [Actinomycetota bacterium]|nr:hypothetical protein [Actinomycetota bacterium]
MRLAHRSPRLSMDGIDLVVFMAFGASSLWVLGLDLWQVVVHGRSWTGTDGAFVQDQMQYLAWIGDASRHVLVSNLFVVRDTPADYLNPLVSISGGLAALGLAPSLVLLAWKPMAVGGVFFAIRAYVHRMIDSPQARRVALVLALFAGWVGLAPDLWLPFWSWGYPFALIGLAAMLAAILMYERDRGTGRLGWTAPLLAALSSWLHPWQGESLILILLCAEGVMGKPWGARRGARLLLTVSAASVPLAYYAILGRSDRSWGLGQELFRNTYPAWKLLLVAALLGVPTVLGSRVRPRTFLTTMTLAW